jgi:hypothetical protein
MTRAEALLAEVQRRGAFVWIADGERLRGAPAEVFDRDPQLRATIIDLQRDIVAELLRRNPAYRQAIAVVAHRIWQDFKNPSPPAECTYHSGDPD